jgi:hypothetical protein
LLTLQVGANMGFSYRKSFKAGPLRITASKSGISYSAGVKGVRVTKRANGRVETTLSAPGTGLRYTSNSGGTKRAKPSAKPVPRSAPAQTLRSAPLTPGGIKALYELQYVEAVKQLRAGVPGAELRGRLHSHGLNHPKILKAITDAERHVAKTASQTRDEALAAEAARQLRSGVPRRVVAAWVKQRGVAYWDRGRIMNRAAKISSGN